MPILIQKLIGIIIKNFIMKEGKGKVDWQEEMLQKGKA